MPILDQYGQPMPTRRQLVAKQLHSRYDAAQTTTNNQRHWSNADLLSADSANNPGIRATLRSRARYEVHESNSFANGIIKTLANYLIGPGPHLKMQTRDFEFNQLVQRSWRRWCRLVRFAPKLRTLRMAKATDGEGIALKIHNPRLNHEVKLDLRLVEADQMATSHLMGSERNRIDGVDFDAWDNPLRYWFLQDHPGSEKLTLHPFYSEPIDARYVIHWFRQDRAGQHRGIPELTPALPLFALVRRYVLAVVGAAESAAFLNAVMYTDSNQVDPDEDVEPMDAIDLEMRAMLTLPRGWKVGQVKAEQPTTTFEMFRNALWNEAARCVLMPFNIAAGNSAGYNFASGRLDHQAFDLAIDTDRADCTDVVLESVFEDWLREFLSVRSGIAPSDIDVSEYIHAWYWPPREHVDPQKNANAKSTMWHLGLLSDDDILFEEGKDPEEHFETLERQVARRKRLGLPLPGQSKPAAQESGERGQGTGEERDETEEELEEEEELADA